MGQGGLCTGLYYVCTTDDAFSCLKFRIFNVWYSKKSDYIFLLGYEGHLHILCRVTNKLLTTLIHQRSDYIIRLRAAARSNRFKQIQETHLAYSAANNIRGRIWMKNNIPSFIDNKLLSVKPCMLFFIQTLPRVLCAGAISQVSFLDLFEPIADATNLIGLYSWKRNNLNPGISLTSQTLFVLLLFCKLVLPAKNIVRRSNQYVKKSISHYFPWYHELETKRKKK